AVEVAAPDRAGPAIGVVAGPLAALAVRRLEAVYAGVADAEIELAVRPDQDAVDAVIVVVAAEAAQQLLGRAVRLAVAVFVLEHENVRRVADVDAAGNPSLTVGALMFCVGALIGIRRDRDAERGDEVGGLVKRRRLVRFAGALGVFEDDDAVAFLAIGRFVVELAAVVDRLAHPDAALVVDVDARGIDEQRLAGPECKFEAIRDGEGGLGFFGRNLGAGGRDKQQGNGEYAQTSFHDWLRLRGKKAR